MARDGEGIVPRRGAGALKGAGFGGTTSIVDRSFTQRTNDLRIHDAGSRLNVFEPPTPFFHTFIRGGSARDRVVVGVMPRRRDDFIAPYAYVLLGYGNEMLQMAVPSPEMDRALIGENITLKPYPCTSKEDIVGGRSSCPSSPWTLSGTKILSLPCRMRNNDHVEFSPGNPTVHPGTDRH